MQEIIEFRINEKFASKLFADNEGKKLGDSIRKIEISTDDPQYKRIGELDRKLSRSNNAFFYSWNVRRYYTSNEIEAAGCFHLNISTIFEPAGEECGTKYDETTACPQCGSGAVQVSDLRLDLRKVPKNKHIARTIAGADEVIVSQWLAEKMIDSGFTGFELRPVRHKARYEDDALDLRQVPTGREILRKAKAANAPHPTGAFYVWLNRAENKMILDRARAEYVTLEGRRNRQRSKPMPVWHQLIVTSVDTEIVPPTRVGINPFDEDAEGEYRCQHGDLIGLNLLSEVSISATSLGNADIISTWQFIGARRGLLRPKRIILISPKMRRLIESEKLGGAELEIAHIV